CVACSTSSTQLRPVAFAREVLHVEVTRHPTAEWAAQQIVECCAWDRRPPRFLIHDRDSRYGIWSLDPAPVTLPTCALRFGSASFSVSRDRRQDRRRACTWRIASHLRAHRMTDHIFAPFRAPSRGHRPILTQP